jgi:restriction system protein
MKPIVAALGLLGGSASNSELYEAVVDRMGLSDEQLAVIHDPERGEQTEAAYRMAWARTWLKKAGFLENSSRGVWALTPKGRDQEIDPDQVVAYVRAEYSAERAATAASADVLDATLVPPDAAELDAPADWRGRLLRRLQALAPDAFERLCQRVLRESGFVEVRVTGRSGDGGIDGIGILRMQRVVSFQVLFQCKRYQGTVGSKEIRDFRGAMVGRSDKGLFLTTGSFSRGAQEEATRNGAPPLDLIDGERLADLLKELSLGVQTTMIEKVDIDEAWFDGV